MLLSSIPLMALLASLVAPAIAAPAWDPADSLRKELEALEREFGAAGILRSAGVRGPLLSYSSIDTNWLHCSFRSF